MARISFQCWWVAYFMVSLHWWSDFIEVSNTLKSAENLATEAGKLVNKSLTSLVNVAWPYALLGLGPTRTKNQSVLRSADSKYRTQPSIDAHDHVGARYEGGGKKYPAISWEARITENPHKMRILLPL